MAARLIAPTVRSAGKTTAPLRVGRAERRLVYRASGPLGAPPSPLAAARRPAPGAAPPVPAYSRIVFRAGAVSYL